MLLNFKANSLPALLLAATLGASPMVYADGWGPGGTAQPTPDVPFNTGVSEGDLVKVANVNVKAQEIQRKYEAQFDGAKTMHDVENIQQQMQGELIDAIHEQDISLEEYKQVALAVEKDPGLRARFAAMVTEKARPQGE